MSFAACMCMCMCMCAACAGARAGTCTCTAHAHVTCACTCTHVHVHGTTTHLNFILGWHGPSNFCSTDVPWVWMLTGKQSSMYLHQCSVTLPCLRKEFTQHIPCATSLACVHFWDDLCQDIVKPWVALLQIPSFRKQEVDMGIVPILWNTWPPMLECTLDPPRTFLHPEDSAIDSARGRVTPP